MKIRFFRSKDEELCENKALDNIERKIELTKLNFSELKYIKGGDEGDEDVSII